MLAIRGECFVAISLLAILLLLARLMLCEKHKPSLVIISGSKDCADRV